MLRHLKKKMRYNIERWRSWTFLRTHATLTLDTVSTHVSRRISSKRFCRKIFAFHYTFYKVGCRTKWSYCSDKSTPFCSDGKQYRWKGHFLVGLQLTVSE